MAEPQVEREARGLRGLLRNRPLFLLWAGQVISQSGDAVFELALLWLALELTGSTAAAGLIAAATYLPALVFGLFGGVLADRFDQRRLMWVSDLARAAIAFAIPVLSFTGLLTVWTLGVLSFALACFTAAFNPARDALLPRLVTPAQLVPANSLLQTCWQLSLVVGPLIAAGLIPLVGVVHLFSVDGLSFLASFALIFAMRVPAKRLGGGGQGAGEHQSSDRVAPPETTPLPEERGERVKDLPSGALRGFGGAGRDVLEGLRFVVKDARIAGLLMVTALDNLFLMGPALVGVPIFVREVLHGGAVVYAGSALPYASGMLIGTVLLNLWGKRFPGGAVLLGGMVMDGLTLLPFFWIQTVGQLWVTLLLHGMATPLIVITRPTLVQTLVPAGVQGRVFGMIGTAVVGFSALSSALTGVVAEKLEIRTLFLAIALLSGGCGALGMLFGPLRRAGPAQALSLGDSP